MATDGLRIRGHPWESVVCSITSESRSMRAHLSALLLLAAAPAAAQDVTVPADHPRVKAALDQLRAQNAWTLDQQESICEVPAPPFKEAQRAAEYKRRLEALGFRDVRIDA